MHVSIQLGDVARGSQSVKNSKIILYVEPMIKLTDAQCRYDKSISYLKIVFCKDFGVSLLTGAREMTLLQSSFLNDVTVIKCTICGKGR